MEWLVEIVAWVGTGVSIITLVVQARRDRGESSTMMPTTSEPDDADGLDELDDDPPDSSGVWELLDDDEARQ